METQADTSWRSRLGAWQSAPVTPPPPHIVGEVCKSSPSNHHNYILVCKKTYFAASIRRSRAKPLFRITYWFKLSILFIPCQTFALKPFCAQAMIVIVIICNNSNNWNLNYLGKTVGWPLYQIKKLISLLHFGFVCPCVYLRVSSNNGHVRPSQQRQQTAAADDIPMLQKISIPLPN